MKAEQKAAKDVDEYISGFPTEVRAVLNKVRTTIRKAIPQAVEKISYGIPAYILNGGVVYFAGWKKFIGFYPTSSGISHFKRELAAYRLSKGTAQFPLDQPIPYALIAKIAKFRAAENQRKKTAKRGRK